MISKMSLEEFREIKSENIKLYDEIWKLISEAVQLPKSDRDAKEMEINNLKKRAKSLQDRLLSSDLSEIPFEEWEGLSLIGNKLDFSKTHANIDFSLLDDISFENIDISGCNVRGLQALDYKIFSPEFMREHPEFFPDESLPEEIRQKFFDKKLTFTDLFEYPSLRKCVSESCFRYSYSVFDSTVSFIGAVGYENAIKFFDEYPEFSFAITNKENHIFFHNKYEGEKSYDSIKKFVFKEVIDEVKNHHFTKLPSFDVIPQEMKDFFPGIFINHDEISEELYNKFFNGELSVRDIRDNRDFFKDKDLIFGIRSYGRYIITGFSVNNIFEVKTIDLFDTIFGSIWDYFDNFPEEFDDIIEAYLKNIQMYKDKIKQLESQKIDDIMTEAIELFLNRDNKIDSIGEIYHFSRYLPVEKLVGDEEQKKFIQKFGLDNLIEYNFNNNGILDLMVANRSDNEKVTSKRLWEEIALYFDENSNNISIDNDSEINQFIYELISSGKRINTKKLPKIFKDKYPELYLDSDAPEDLQSVFYDGSLDSIQIYMNPEWIPYLMKIDLSRCLIPITDFYGKSIYAELAESCSNEDILKLISRYGICLDELLRKLGSKSKDKLIEFTRSGSYETEINQCVYELVYNGKVSYTGNLPQSFKDKYPSLFLSGDTPEEIQKKFYERKITVADFDKNPELLNYFRNVDIALGFDISYMSWLNQVADNKSIEEINLKKLKIIRHYEKLDDEIKRHYSYYIKTHFELIDDRSLEILDTVLSRLYYSNSAKLAHLYEELATSILQSADPLEKLEEIEQIYLSNHLPDVAKTYAVFRVFHTQKDGNIEISNSVASPFLKSEHNQNFREMAIFSDLIKASIDSNSKSIRDYIKVVVDGDKLYKDILNGREINVNDEEIQQKLNYYSRVLIALHNNSLKGREKPYQSTGDVLTDIGVCTKLLSRNDSLDYDMTNRITRMFLHFAGFDTIEELTKYMDEKVQKTNDKNKDFSKDGTKLHKGQLIKGLKSVDYLHFNLQNGCVASDFLGSQAKKEGDCTPLDIDVALVMDDEIDIDSAISKSCASCYGPPWIIVDTDEDFYDSTDNHKYQKGKYELFSAKQSQNDWYGVRTGFGSTHIRCIVVNEYTEKIGFEIALAGFYISVKDRQGNLLFSEQAYKDLVAKMAGLKYYDKPEYAFSPNLVTPEIDNLRREKIADKERVSTLGTAVKKKIYEAISSFEFLPGKNLTPKGVMDGDLTAGFVEVIDTGSTGRETNAPGDGDFDFMLRIDNDILKDSKKMDLLRDALCSFFGVSRENAVDPNGEIRIKNLEIVPGHKVDVDISFKPKTDEIDYSTDMCLKDRLGSIKKQNPEKYEYVVANICYAKKVLQEAGCYYKHGHSKCTGKGGLGGVGVENWILQNGGSFVDAARSFVDVAYNNDKTGFASWEEFKSKYKVWDFGENFREGRYDEFIHDNMDQAGYEAMCKYLKSFIDQYDHKQAKSDELSDMIETQSVNDDGIDHILI